MVRLDIVVCSYIGLSPVYATTEIADEMKSEEFDNFFVLVFVAKCDWSGSKYQDHIRTCDESGCQPSGLSSGLYTVIHTTSKRR